jgi:uncharacterized protein YgbK (DUF1537 family)
MNPRLLVMADDLTGALDTGVQFASAGVRTTVVTHRYLARSLWSCEAPVLVVDTESRHLAPSQAGLRVASCVRAGRGRGVDCFYKKTDSTLRGNVGAELEALLAASGERELFFVPSLPKAGRVTRSGVPWVNGIPLHESSFARDPRDPIRGTSIQGIIGSQSRVPVAIVGRGVGAVPAPAGRDRPLIVAFDAETDDDLEAIAGRLAGRGIPHLTAGSSGFAGFLPGLYRLPTGSLAAVTLRPPLLIVSGSLHERSLDQLFHAELRGAASMDVDPQGAARLAWRREATQTAVGQIRKGGTAIVRCRPGPGTPVRDAEALAWNMGKLVRAIADATAVRTVAVFGGDTTLGVVTALNVRSLEPVREICQGTVVSRVFLQRGVAAGFHLVTKAGGFGPVDVIDRIAGALERGD